MPSTISVAAKVLGQCKPLVVDWSVSVPPDWQDRRAQPSLGELITRIVLAEVDALAGWQEQCGLAHLLSSVDIQEGGERGKAGAGGREPGPPPDAQAAVEAALGAFGDGLYLVFVDGEQQFSLDSAVRLGPESRVTFIRLVALAGG